MQKIDEFMEDLLKKKGLSDIDSEIKKEQIADMKKQLEAQLNRACIQALQEEKAAELAKLVETPDFSIGKMTDFMQKSGVDFEKIALKTLQQFKDFYLGEEVKNV